MQIIEDQKIFEPLVRKAINKYGFAPDHNFGWFVVYVDRAQKPVVALWDNGEIELAHKADKDWYTFSEPLAKERNRGQKVAELASFVLKNYSDVEKVITEALEDTRQEVIDHLSDNLRIIDHTEDSENNYMITWPVMNMEKFNPALPGGHFKYLRNARSKFYRNQKIEIREATEVSKKDLHDLIDRWVVVAKQKEVELIHEEPYHNLIANDFRGLDAARVMIADGKIVGLNGGWDIPNSKTFYAAIGIHDYSLPDLGLMLYLEDLEWIKKAGYLEADMGGVDEGSPLNFKNQFLPDHWYKSYVFTIVRK